MVYKIGDKIRNKKTGETFMIITKSKKGYDITDDYTEFGKFTSKQLKEEFTKK